MPENTSLNPRGLCQAEPVHHGRPRMAQNIQQLGLEPPASVYAMGRLPLADPSRPPSNRPRQKQQRQQPPQQQLGDLKRAGGSEAGQSQPKRGGKYTARNDSKDRPPPVTLATSQNGKSKGTSSGSAQVGGGEEGEPVMPQPGSHNAGPARAQVECEWLMWTTAKRGATTPHTTAGHTAT